MTEDDVVSFLADGVSGNVELEKNWLREALSIYRLFQQKQHDYGSTNIALSGELGVITRITDKVSRLVNLFYNRQMEGDAVLVKNGSIDDTIKDIADYSIILMLVRNKLWPTASIKEMWKLE